MSEQKRYTAQQIERIVEHLEKDENDSIWEVYVVDKKSVELRTSDVVAMLRQAVDAEDELAKLREENAKLTNIINTECNTCGDCVKFGKDCTAGDVDGNEDCRACKKFVPKEVAQLKARLEAVVKIASDNLWCEDSGVVETDTCAKLHNSYMSDILRAARGEGGAE